MTPPKNRYDERGAIGTALAMLLLGVIVQRCTAAVGAVHERRMAARPVAPPRRVQRWEGEGGNVMTPQTNTDAGAGAPA